MTVMTIEECLSTYTQFDDSLELAERLDEMAQDADPQTRYTLKEAAQNLEGMHHLIRSMAHRIQELTSNLARQAGQHAKD